MCVDIIYADFIYLLTYLLTYDRQLSQCLRPTATNWSSFLRLDCDDCKWTVNVFSMLQLTIAVPRIFICRATAQLRVWGTNGIQGRSHDTGSGGRSCTSSKQLARTSLQIWTNKRSKFENFAQFTSWFLTAMFHRRELAKPHFDPSRLPSPLTVNRRNCTARRTRPPHTVTGVN